ncbi:MAG TPA: ATP-binding protein [Pilimelia sp.]|nr:ATP-binding protein [Pilimelia sp.]
MAESTDPLFTADFSRGDLAQLRQAVTAHAGRAGLTGQRLDDFVLAVNEVVTNAVRHAGGRGRLRMWANDEAVCCEIADAGGGIPAERLFPQRPPAASTAGGRGIWMARQLCDELAVETGPSGTTVCVQARLAHAP